MRRTFSSIALGGAFLVLVATTARPARAFDGTVGDYDFVIAGAIVALTLDLGFTAVDLGYALRDRPLPLAYGAIELLIAGPQAYLLVSSSIASLRGGWTPPAWNLVLAAWTTALAVHGGYTIFRPRPVEPPPDQARVHARAGPAWTVAPALLGAAAAPGAVLSGRF